METYSFVPLKKFNLALLHGWLQEAHVRAFWDDGDRTPEQVRAHYFQPRSVDQFLILHQNKPIGYIQSCLIDEKHELAKFRAKQWETHGVDLFIGEKNEIGKGHAIDILNAFFKFLSEHHPLLKTILFDPSENNPRAIHIFVKLGAKPIGTHKEKAILLLSL
jgi:aminoglycoside 6'-N-acetyltransferase